MAPSKKAQTDSRTDIGRGRMLARRRQELIRSELRRRGSVRVRELTELLGVSDMTVRRDLDAMAAAGLLDKVHGGATARSGGSDAPSSLEPGFVVKSEQQLFEKQAIAASGAEMIQPGTAIGITAGTTTWQLAHYLAGIRNLVVVTNSLRVAQVLQQTAHEHTVVVTGGEPTPSDAMVGPVAERALASVHLDQLFMGVHGMDPRSGLTSPNLTEVRTNQVFAEAANQLIVMADHTKWGTVGLSTIVPLTEVDVLISDSGLSTEAQTNLAELGTKVIMADPFAAAASASVSSVPSLSTTRSSGSSKSS